MDELYEQRCIKTRVYKKCPDETSHDTLHKFAGNIQMYWQYVPISAGFILL